MRWVHKIWCYLVGTVEECCIEDPRTALQVKHLVKRAYVMGIVTGFLLCGLLYKGYGQ